jgi:hypothetical protein
VKYYASNCGPGRNREAIRAAGFGVLLNPADPHHWDVSGMPYVLDNGAWVAFLNETDFDPEPFERLLEARGDGADFIILPDIVAGGMASLELSLRWTNRCLAVCPLVLIAVQDGMEPADLAPYVGTSVGIFMGGSTAWKLARMQEWGEFCASRPCAHPLGGHGCWYHIGRVNTLRRFSLAAMAGADSADGSSASRYSVNVPKLQRGRDRGALFTPQAMRAQG